MLSACGGRAGRWSARLIQIAVQRRDDHAHCADANDALDPVFARQQVARLNDAFNAWILG
jgi:hypothetical protein